MKRTATTKLQSWCLYSSNVVGAKQSWRSVSWAWVLERPQPLTAERCRRRLVSLEEAVARRYFRNWKGEKPRPDAPVTLERRI